MRSLYLIIFVHYYEPDSLIWQADEFRSGKSINCCLFLFFSKLLNRYCEILININVSGMKNTICNNCIRRRISVRFVFNFFIAKFIIYNCKLSNTLIICDIQVRREIQDLKCITKNELILLKFIVFHWNCLHFILFTQFQKLNQFKQLKHFQFI